MGRPSKLTDKQWAQISKRVLHGEKPADLAREYGVHPAAISRRVAQPAKETKRIANQLVTAEQELRALPIAQQLEALNLADELRAISMHLAGAAKFGSATAHRLAGIAHGKVQEIDDAAPLSDSMDALRNVAALTKLANDASQIGVNLLAANKDHIKRLQDAEDEGADADDDARAMERAQRLEAIAARAAGAGASR